MSDVLWIVLAGMTLLQVIQTVFVHRLSRKLDDLKTSGALKEGPPVSSSTHDLTSRLDELQSMRFSYMGTKTARERRQ